HTEKGFVYLTSIMDLFSRRIIAWRLSETLEAKWVVECVLEARKLRRTIQPLVLHSDRGSQYVSSSYLEALGVCCKTPKINIASLKNHNI
ncbi:MAG: DDE-type integrase/transposase/recombinase, partial [Desulfitobacteriaceae bacterium]|nr:DDE-type integrase/transposase/recombinase [Desulfitobacteriaceae bacterium]